MDELSLIQKKNQIVKVTKSALGIGLACVVAPFVFLAIKGVVGLTVAAITGLVAINAIPVLAEKMANWKLKNIKVEAMKNPVETLQRDYEKRQASLLEFKGTITSFQASVYDFSDKLQKFKGEFPDDAEKFEGQLEKMKKLLDIRKKKYKEAEAALVRYDKEIARADAIWKMSLEAAKMNKASGMNEKDIMEKIKVETSLDSITSNMNRALAELESSLVEEEEEKGFPPSMKTLEKAR